MLSSLFILGLLATTAMAAQDGRGHPMVDPLLDKLVGKWRLERVMGTRKLENTANVEWVLDHQFLLIHMVGATHPPAYEAQIYIGYSNADKRYVAHWLDVFGGKFSETLGFGHREGDSIEFNFQYPDGLCRNTFAWNPETKTWTSTIVQKAETGDWVPFCTDTYSHHK